MCPCNVHITKETELDESPEGKLWTLVRKFFSGKTENPIEDVILEARTDGELEAFEASMLINVLRMGRKQVREIMIPRTDIQCVELNASIQDVAELIIEQGHSRIPVYRENKDHIVGITHAKDLLPYLLQHCDTPPDPLSAIMRPPFFIPETKNVKNMIAEFQAQKVHMAIALDEYGGTSGLVTFEDVLEEIVGEIEDEYDLPRPEDIQPLEDGRHLVSGRTSLNDLQEETGIALTSDQVETIGGFVTELAGRVPMSGEEFEYLGHNFRIEEADSKQVYAVSILPGPETDNHNESDGEEQ